MTGIPRTTIRDWRSGKSRIIKGGTSCEGHDFEHLNGAVYTYLLGMYLGDGCISKAGRTWVLRITLDSRYVEIIGECQDAVEAVVGRRAAVYTRPDSNCVEVRSYWNHWPCFFPQHGAGRKHERPISLAPWQERFAEAYPKALVCGLLHSDGTRIVATERKGNYVRRAARYGFSNRSEDIHGIFTAALERIGVHYTRASRKQVAIYSKAAVAELDKFVGPKR